LACKPEVFKGEKYATDSLRWIEEMETTIDVIGFKDKDKVRFAAKSFKGEAHIWWKTIMATWGKEKATSMDWRKFRKVAMKKYVSNHEVEQLEDEYLHLKMEGTDYRKYTSRFFEITGLIPDFAGSESKRTSRFIWGAHCDTQYPGHVRTVGFTQVHIRFSDFTAEVLRSYVYSINIQD
jgi:hypothetical protein